MGVDAKLGDGNCNSLDIMFTQAMFDFFCDIGEMTDCKMKSVALIHEDTIFSTDGSNAQKQMAEAAGIKITADLRYRDHSPSLSAEEQLKAADADVIIPSSCISDAVLMVHWMHDVGYMPRAIMAQSAGFSEWAIIDAAELAAEVAADESVRRRIWGCENTRRKWFTRRASEITGSHAASLCCGGRQRSSRYCLMDCSVLRVKPCQPANSGGAQCTF